MEATELRIGNWVLIPMGVERVIPAFPKQVLGISKFGQLDFSKPEYFESLIVQASHYGGVPLTEEIFIKALGKNAHHKSISFGEDTGLEIAFIGGECSLYIQYEGFGINEIKVIQYVHQLQNLYFALTGKELEVKL